MKSHAPKLKVRINKKLNDVDLTKIAPEKVKKANELMSNVKLPE
jgi:hypothetical protein